MNELESVPKAKEAHRTASPALQAALDRLLSSEADDGEPDQLPDFHQSDTIGRTVLGYDNYCALPAVSLKTPEAQAAQEVDVANKVIHVKSQERLRANLAQQRYRDRLRQRDQDCQVALQTLSEKLQDLKFETRQLAARQRLMQELVEKQEYHLCVLLNTQECMQMEAKLLPQELAAAMSTSGWGDVTPQQAQQWTLQQWLNDIFPSFLQHLGKLLPAAEVDPAGVDGARIKAVVYIRRGTDARRSLYIQLHAVLMSWNMQMTREIPQEHRPTPAFWRAVLAGLEMTAEQQQQVLEVRERVVAWLAKACDLRAEAYAAISDDLANEAAQGRGVRMLRSALELERRASGHYFYEFLFDVLTPWQEVWLDAGPVCPPWHGNLWAIGEALAVQHGLDPAPRFEALHSAPAEVQPFMPALSGFNLLSMDCLAQGGGLQLKRGLLCCWYLTTGRTAPPGGPPVVMHPRPHELLQLTIAQVQSQSLPQSGQAQRIIDINSP